MAMLGTAKALSLTMIPFWRQKQPPEQPPKSTAELLQLSSYDMRDSTSTDKGGNLPNGILDIQWFTKTVPPVRVAFLKLHPATGQIGFLTTFDEKWRDKGLEEEMMAIAIEAVQKQGTSAVVWEAGVSQEARHYGNDKRFKWTDPVHSSVTSGGWSMELSRSTRKNTVDYSRRKPVDYLS